MNPIGIDFSQILADSAEGEPQQSKVSNAEEKDFLAQFLEMLFADSEAGPFSAQGKSETVDADFSIDGENQEAEPQPLERSNQQPAPLNPRELPFLELAQPLSTARQSEPVAEVQPQVQGSSKVQEEQPLPLKVIAEANSSTSGSSSTNRDSRMSSLPDAVPGLPSSTGKAEDSLSKSEPAKGSELIARSAFNRLEDQSDSDSSFTIRVKPTAEFRQPGVPNGNEETTQIKRPGEGITERFNPRFMTSTGSINQAGTVEHSGNQSPVNRPGTVEHSEIKPMQQISGSPGPNVEAWSVSSRPWNSVDSRIEVLYQGENLEAQKGDEQIRHHAESRSGGNKFQPGQEPFQTEAGKVFRPETPEPVPELTRTREVRVAPEAAESQMAASTKSEKESLQQEPLGMKTETESFMVAGRTVVRQGDSQFLEPAVQQSRQPLPEDSFDEILDQIVRRVSLDRSGDSFRLDIRLKPEFLGRLHIETVMQADQSMKTVIQAEDPLVKALLESKIPMLLRALGDVGLNLETVQVETLLSDLGSEIDQDENKQNARNGESEGRESQGRDKAFQESTDSSEPEDFGDGRIHFFI